MASANGAELDRINYKLTFEAPRSGAKLLWTPVWLPGRGETRPPGTNKQMPRL